MIKLVFWLIPLVFLGLSFLARQGERRRAATAEAWPSAAGRVVASEVTSRSINGNYWMPQVSYAFEAAGASYASDRLRPGGNPQFTTKAKAQAIVDRYPPGSACTVRYDPKKPAVSALELAPQNTWSLSLAIIAAVTGGLALLVSILA